MSKDGRVCGKNVKMKKVKKNVKDANTKKICKRDVKRKEMKTNVKKI